MRIKQSRGEQMADAIDEADRLFPGKHWLFGKGRIQPDEPLYGFRVFEPGDEDLIVAQAEHDDPIECVMLAVDIGREGRIAKVDTVVAAVRADLLRRSELGIAKYGVTLDRTDLNLRDWLQHAYEEHLDAANYLKRAIMEIDRRADGGADIVMQHTNIAGAENG